MVPDTASICGKRKRFRSSQKNYRKSDSWKRCVNRLNSLGRRDDGRILTGNLT